MKKDVIVLRFNIGEKIVDFSKCKRSHVRNWRALNEILLKTAGTFLKNYVKFSLKLIDILVKGEIHLKIASNSLIKLSENFLKVEQNSLENSVKFSRKNNKIFLKIEWNFL